MKSKGMAARYVNNRGYVLVHVPEHWRANCQGYVYEHILVLETALKRRIRRTEACHHIDGDRTNNAVGNLMVFATNKMHADFHARLRAFAVCGHYDWRKCTFCKTYDSPDNLRCRARKAAYHTACENAYKRQWRELRKQRGERRV